MNTKSCFAPAHILLPSEQIPLEKWGCIACDQFTSDRDYWQKAEAAAAGSPSTLNMILPEVYLEDGDADARIEKIHATMDDYARNVLTRAVDGFVTWSAPSRAVRCGRALWAWWIWKPTATAGARNARCAPARAPWKAASRPA